MTSSNEEFKDRLQLVTDKTSVSDFGRKCGIGESTLRKYLKGASPRLDKIIAIAEAANVNIEWLATGVGPMRGSTPDPIVVDGKPVLVTGIPQWQTPDPETFYYVPMAEAQLSAGGGMFVLSEDISDYYAFRKDWLNRIATSAKSLVLMAVNGNSMHPTVQNKDTVLIDTERLEIHEGLLYALRLDSTIMVKRLTHRPGDIINVISDNKEEFETYQAERKDIHVIGQVIHLCRDLASS